MRKSLLRWTRGPKQGYFDSFSDRAFRSLGDGKLAVAAWLRNTTPHRGAQFQTMSVSASNVGQSTVAADLRSYLASTVRVVSPVSNGHDEPVTISPSQSKLSFSKTDKIASWADFVEVSFAWLAHAETTTAAPVFLPGTADVSDSLAGVGKRA